MKKILVLAVLFGSMACMKADLWAKSTFVTIGTGGITGVYYSTGGAIAKLVNKKRDEYGIRATIESTDGSVFNINAVLSGDLEFGIVQSDRQYQAVHGEAEWSDRGPQKDLCSVFSIYPEFVTLLVTEDSGITTLNDLRGKRVSIGNTGSGQRQNAIDALMAVGINMEKDMKAESMKPSDAPRLLQEGRLDAFFYTVGHPNSAFKEATSGGVKVRFIPVSGPGIDELVKEKSYYTKCSFSPKTYSGAVNEEEHIQTFGVKATLCTSINVPEEVVYAIAKEVFSNIGEFRKMHPAFAEMTKESMLQGLSAPFHPGAEKYLKEAGLVK